MLKADARRGRAARLPEFRMRRGHQQHARPGAVAPGRGALPHARRALQIRQRADDLHGFKAGALRLAMAHTAADAEIIGIIDADYVVHAGLAERSGAGCSPIRRSASSRRPRITATASAASMHHAMNGEYAGFFDIGMVQRNESNAIIVHGTMCLIRRAALERAGGWSSDTICEDTDLGLTMLELGWLAHYTNRRYGHGLLPDNFEAYKKQRDRWASGGFQIVKKHWRRFLPGASLLTRDQKREFALRLAQLARRRERRRRWSPSSISSGCRSSPLSDIAVPDRDSDLADHRDLRDFDRAFRRAVPAARAHPARTGGRRHGGGHGDAVDGGARRRDGIVQGSSALRAHRQRRQGAAQGHRLPRLLGSDPGRPAACSAQRSCSRPISSGCARSTCSLSCWWCRACRSSPRSLAAFENSRFNDFACGAARGQGLELLPRECCARAIAEASAAPEKRMEAAP